MTAINRLTQVQYLSDDDLFPLWDSTNGRTRNVKAETLKEYASADEVVNARIEGDHLILIKEDGSEIDAGKLPSSDGIDLQNDGADIGEFSTLNFGEGLVAKPSETFGVVAEVDIDKDKVYTKDVDLPIKIDDLTDITGITTGIGLYSLKKDNDAELVNRAPFARTLRFDQSITLSDPYDGLTAIYATENTAVDDVLHLDIDPDDPRLNKDWVFTVAIDSDITKSTLECKIGKTNPISFNLATGFAVLEVDSQKGEFVVHNQSSTVTGDLPSTFCNLNNSEWKNIPSKEWIVREGTLAGFGAGVDGKTAKLRCQVSNSSIDTTEIALRAIDHVYTIISDDATINGRVFVRSAKSKATFDAAVLREETNNTGSGEITVDGNAADKIVSGEGIKTTFDAASKTATIIAEDFDQPDVAGFGTVSELPRHLIKPQFDDINLLYDYDYDRFKAKFANGEPGPAFKVTAQKLENTKWELGFTYDDRLSSHQTVMSRMLVQFLPDESTGTFDDLVSKVDFRCEKGLGGVFKHKHEGQDLLELWCIAATSEYPNRFFLELDLSANDDKYVFNTREPQFTEYLFPWNDINKPPQFVQLEEGMNNQGKMGSGSNIDSGSITQGKVYVDDFIPSNGGPEGLEGNARKGYVIKHYGFNDQETASVIWFYNFVGDIYVKMNKNQEDKGRWNKVTGSRFANTRTPMLDATEQEYLEVNRTNPVIATEEIDSLTLCKATDPESESELPKVRKATMGELASGFSVCPDGTVADTQILQASSGTYSLETMVFAVGAAADDPVYVDPDGKLTLDQSDYVVGWVLSDGVIIDIDLYNATVTAKNVSELPENPVFKTLNIDTSGAGLPNYSAVIRQNDSLITEINATRELRLNQKDILSGDTKTVMSVMDTQITALAPIYEGSSKVALEKDVPTIPDNGYLERYARADTDYVQIAYGGKYDDDRTYYPVSISQDPNGWTQVKFTGYMQFKSIDKATGELGDTAFEIRSNRVVAKKLPYYNDDKLATRTNNHIANSASLGDLIYTNGQSVNEWIADNPDYSPSELLEVIFDCKLLDMTNWVVSFTTSGTDYNGTFPASYQQVEIHKTGGSARDFMRAYNKESHTHYFAPYKAGQDPVWKAYAYQQDVSEEIDEKISADKAKGEWIGGVFFDTINDDGNPEDYFDLKDPKHYIDFRKTSVSAEHFTLMQQDPCISTDVTIYLNPESGITKQKFHVKSSDGKYRDYNVRLGEKWRIYIRKGGYPYGERLDDGTSNYVDESELTFAIEENNDDIITPSKGQQFQLVDSEKASSYGNANKQVTYFAPVVGTQSEMLLTKLDYGKAFAIHEQVDTAKLFMILHESLVAEIYNRDLTGVNEVTMLFTGDSRGRLAKANQTAAQQFAINWNGELIPATRRRSATSSTTLS